MPRVALQQPYARYHGVARTPGNVGGQVLWSVGNSAYARAFVVPANPLSNHQTAVRSILSTAANGYQALTAAQAAAWSTMAAGISRTNPVGGQYNLSGIAFYCQVNYWRLVGGVGLSAVPPTPDPVAAPLSIDSATVNGTDLDIVVTHATAVSVNKWAVRVTRDLGSAARRARRNELQVLTDAIASSFVSVTSSPQTISLAIEYVSIAAGNHIGIEVLPVSQDAVPGTPLFNRNILVG